MGLDRFVLAVDAVLTVIFGTLTAMLASSGRQDWAIFFAALTCLCLGFMGHRPKSEGGSGR